MIVEVHSRMYNLGHFVILVMAWVGLWGMLEIIIERIADNNFKVKFLSNAILATVALFIFWCIDDDPY